MNKKSTQILLSILHICILGICVLTIYSNRNSASEAMVAHVSSDTRVIDSQPEPEADTASGTEAEPAADTNTVPEPPATDTDIIPEASTEPEQGTEADTGEETIPSYSFRYIGTYLNLNIRSTPSLDGEIIGKVPPGRSGSVIELTNDGWALIDYQDIIGYCSRDYIELQETED